MRPFNNLVKRTLAVMGVMLVAAAGFDAPARAQSTPTIFQATLQEAGQLTAEISTEDLEGILARGDTPVLDVRSPLEYAIAHIPGAINIPEQEVARIMQLYFGLNAKIVLTCNGPFCGKSKRTSEQLILAGYPSANLTRYQLGIPVWRALGNTVQTDLAGFLHILRHDHTAVFVDARTPQEFASGTLRCAVNIQAGEATAANDDGRLPKWDKGARVSCSRTAQPQPSRLPARLRRKRTGTAAISAAHSSICVAPRSSTSSPKGRVSARIESTTSSRSACGGRRPVGERPPRSPGQACRALSRRSGATCLPGPRPRFRSPSARPLRRTDPRGERALLARATEAATSRR